MLFGVNVAHDPFLNGVIDDLVSGVFVFDADVGAEFIGVDGLGLVPDVAFDEPVERLLADVGDALEPDLAVPLDRSGNPGLPLPAAGTDTAPSATYKRFVHLDDSTERWAVEFVVAHRFTDSVAQIPCRPVGDINCPLDLESGHSLLGLAHQVDRKEPFAKRKVGVVHDGTRSHRKLMLAGSALELVPYRKLEHVFVAATRTGNPIRPAQPLKGSEALFVGTELVNERE